MNLDVQSLLFTGSGLLVLVGSVMVVSSRDLVRSVLWLALVLVATSALYVSLSAEFVGAVQVLLYAGGVITLMLFGLMLTSRITGARILHESHHRLRGALAALGLFAVMAAAILATPSPAPVEPAALERLADPRALGHAFLTEQALALEVLSVLLLVVMVGAIVLARPKDAA
jgi:NADH-quinone oxidoreductase subunit J